MINTLKWIINRSNESRTEVKKRLIKVFKMVNTIKRIKNVINLFPTPHKYNKNVAEFLKKMMPKPEWTLTKTPFIINYQILNKLR
jgi:hypothetical protein